MLGMHSNNVQSVEIEESHQALVPMELLRTLLSPPRIEIKHIDPETPRTRPRAKPLPHRRIREVHVLIVPSKPPETHLHRPVHLPIEIHPKKPRQILLHHHVVLQQYNLPQLGEHLRQVKPQVLQHIQIPPSSLHHPNQW